MSRGVALVTGGSRGIGRAICCALAGSGPVAINYRTRVEEAKQTLELIESAGGEGIIVEGDVTRPTVVDEMFDRIEEAFGSVAILVNNAGVRVDHLHLGMSDDQWTEVLQTNLFGAFACSRRALRSMIRNRWGRIVNITSVAGLHGNPGQVNYSAAKAGLIGMTRSLAQEVASRGITVNAVAPGLVETDLTSTLTTERMEQLVDRIPMRRAGTPEEIAHVVAFLASEQASYMTGSVVVADGGMAS